MLKLCECFEIHGVDQDRDMPYASDTHITMRAGLNVTFDTAESNFHSLETITGTGIQQNVDVSADADDIDIIHSGGDMEIASGIS